MEPINAKVWNSLQARAARELPPQFADRVLAAAHAGPRTWEKVVWHPFSLSGLTAAACLMGAILMHGHTQARNLTEWQDLAMEVDTLSDL